MISLRSLTAAALALGLGATSVIAASHTTPEGQAVAARKAHMQLYAHNLGILGGMARGNMDYDADAAAAAASNLAKLATMDQRTYWLPGTDSGSMENSRLKPELFDNVDKAIEINMNLAQGAEALAAVAGNGLEALQGAIGPVGGACGECHKAFREPAN